MIPAPRGQLPTVVALMEGEGVKVVFDSGLSLSQKVVWCCSRKLLVSQFTDRSDTNLACMSEAVN